MNDALPILETRAETLRRLGLSAALGAGFTCALFWVIARMELDAPSVVEVVDEVRQMLAPPEPPPPPLPTQPQPEIATPVVGFDLVPAADNPVKIAVPPPDLEALLPPTEVAPPAVIQFGRLDLSFRPKMDLDVTDGRIFQAKDVDQRPTVLYRVEPHIPRHVRKGAEMLRVVLLIIVNADGSLKEARVSRSSGNTEFDTIIAGTIREWAFTPAVRKGVKVRCMLEQAIVIKWDGGSGFTL
jgi:TonB family protein